MLKLLNPEDHYVGALLDEKGEAFKVVCDLLVVAHFSFDTKTQPPSVIVTFDKADEQLPPDEPAVTPLIVTQTLFVAGPMVQHTIIETELVWILEHGVSVENIELSVLRTGIPGAGIPPEDLEYYEAGMRIGELIARIRRQIAQEEERLKNPPVIPNMTPPMMPSQ